MVPLARTYSATVGRSVWQPVRCKYCKCEFAYEVLISARGSSSSPLGLTSIEAMGKSMERAEAELEYKMANYQSRKPIITKIIPCPDCGKLQNNMVKKSNETRQSSLFTILILAAIIMLNPIVAVLYKGIPNPNTPIQWETAYTPTITIPFVVFLVFFVIALVRKQSGIGLIALAAVVVGFTGLFLNLPIGIAIILGMAIGYLMYQYRLAFYANPAVYADRVTPVLRKSEFEELAAKLKAETGIEVPIPVWV